jgi:hypothetical protein
MKRVILAAAASLPFALSALADAGAPSPEVAKARGAIKELAEKLRGELMGAMKAGGPVAAIETCRTVAPGIAKDLSKPGDGFLIGRTALKVRNAQNKPDAFERKVLEDFAQKLKAGADPATLEHSETVTQNGATLVRYMKPIPMAEAPCMACHGPADKIDPAVAAKVKELYPADEATGFAPGELRGAFTVTMTRK